MESSEAIDDLIVMLISCKETANGILYAVQNFILGRTKFCCCISCNHKMMNPRSNIRRYELTRDSDIETRFYDSQILQH